MSDIFKLKRIRHVNCIKKAPNDAMLKNIEVCQSLWACFRELDSWFAFSFEILRKTILRRKHGFFFCSRAEQAYEPGCLDSSRGKSLESNLLRPDFLSEFAKLLSQGHVHWKISIKHPTGKFLASPDTLKCSRWLYGKGSKTWLQLGTPPPQKWDFLGIFPKCRTPPPPPLLGTPVSKKKSGVYFAF